MRAKTTEFLKILNRARPEPKAIEKKTISWVDKLVDDDDDDDGDSVSDAPHQEFVERRLHKLRTTVH